MNLTGSIVTVLDGVETATAVAAAVAVVLRFRRLGTTAGGLLFFVSLLAACWGVTNLLEWTGTAPEADMAEDFLSPLLPVLLLFLFIVLPEQEARERLSRTVDRLGALHRLAAELAAPADPATLMSEVVAQAGRLLGLPLVAILSPEEEGKPALAVRASLGVPSDQAADLVQEAERGPLARAMHRPAPVEFGLDDPHLPEGTTALMRRHGLTGLVAVALAAEGQPLGLLVAGRADGRRFDAEDLRLLRTLCAHAARAIQNARMLARVTESEAKYRAIVENAHAAITVVDAYRHVLFWNRGAERLFGWKAGEVEGHHIEFIYPEDRRAHVVNHILPELQRTGTWAGEYPLVRKDGTPFTGFLSLSRVFDAQGQVICTLGILSDVTERVRLREQLLQAQKMETLGTLAAGIAHDFNNLLSVILGAAGFLKNALPKDSEEYETVLTMEEAARRGTELGRQLMDLSRREPPRTEPLDLNDLVRETVPLLEQAFPPSIAISTRLDPRLRTVRGDKGQLQQVLMNLALNARDAMGEKGTLTVATENLPPRPHEPFAEALEARPGVALIVSDTGCGIPPEHQQRIFEPFVTTKRSKGGTGLGLSTAYAIVTGHGGRIEVESTPGRGATFRIILPAA